MDAGQGSTRIGLTSAAAADRLSRDGPNLVPRGPRRGPVRLAAGQLRDPMILLLLGAFCVVALVGDVADACLILAVIVLNTGIGVVQDVRAGNALDALDRVGAPMATVERDGRFVRVPAPEIVAGDHVSLAAGDVVPADIGLVRASGLEVDESAMTGESVPVGRDGGAEVLAGTVVVRGRADGVVLRTGADSALGRIAASVVAAGVRPTPLQARLRRLSHQLVVLTLAVAGLVLVSGVARGESATDMVVVAVSLAVAAIPESLPAVVTIALALGAFRMARRHALVRRLPAVETLGSVTVLASDKTGTLTEGRMSVAGMWTPLQWRERPVGVACGEPDADLALLVRDLVLCNDAHLADAVDGQVQARGEPTEAALLVAAVEHDPGVSAAGADWRRVDEAPFDSGSKRMATLHQGATGLLLVCKGAPEAVLPALADAAQAQVALREAEGLAARGFRVLAVADAALSSPPPDLARVTELQLRGLVALVDPPRSTARGVVASCRAAGIHPIMITGDHPATARAIADELSITAGAPGVATGAEVERGDHVARIADIGVYARTRPEDKVDIVTAWQRTGAVVAMTGDGVNDAPALRIADIGVAMGNRGTEVARQAADLVLADDDLGTVVVAVQEGRRIYANIRRFLRYGLAGGLAEVLVLLVGPWIGMPLPLQPGQILWINMVTHGLPGVAFSGEPCDPSDMARPSPSPERSVLGGLLPQIGTSAVLISAVALATALAVDGTAAQQTSVFLSLGLAQLWLALALRAPRRGAGWRDRGVEGSVVLAALVLVAGVAWAPLRDLLDTTAVSPVQVVSIGLVAAVPALLVAAAGALRRAGDRSG
ncbi:HAD-IC family P-type ATPase [Nocardioides caricicola]|uniref:Cation-translocating P-type ATPase n=1 Tax=Nocardioides caricicola TaxID=634770 RepID=A0ABW0N544_9ACTN